MPHPLFVPQIGSGLATAASNLTRPLSTPTSEPQPLVPPAPQTSAPKFTSPNTAGGLGGLSSALPTPPPGWSHNAPTLGEGGEGKPFSGLGDVPSVPAAGTKAPLRLNDVRNLNSERRGNPAAYPWGQGQFMSPHGDADSYDTLKDPLAYNNLKADTKPFVAQPSTSPIQGQAYPPLPEFAPGGFQQPTMKDTLQQYHAANPPAAPEPPPTWTGQQWKDFNAYTGGNAGMVGSSVSDAIRMGTPKAFTTPLTEQVGLGNPKLNVGDWARTNPWVNRNLSKEITDMANLDTSPATLAAGAFPAARGFKALRPAGAVGKIEVAGSQVGKAAPIAGAATEAAVPVAAEAGSQVPRASMWSQLKQRAWGPSTPQKLLEFGTGVSPITNAARMAGHGFNGAYRTLTGQLTGQGGALKSFGDAGRAGVSGAIGTGPAMALQGFTPGLTKGQFPGSTAHTEALKADPAAEQVDPSGFQMEYERNPISAIFRKAKVGPTAVFGTAANAVDGGNRYGVGSYTNNLYGNLGALGNEAQKNMPYVVNRTGTALGNLGTSVVGSDAQTAYKQLTQQYRDLNAQFTQGPQTPEAQQAYQQAAQKIRDQVATLDVPGDQASQAAGHDAAGLQWAYQRAQQQYGKGTPTAEALDPQLKLMQDQLQAQGLEPVGKGFHSAALPFPTQQDTTHAFQARGLPVPGSSNVPVRQDIPEPIAQQFDTAVANRFGAPFTQAAQNFQAQRYGGIGAAIAGGAEGARTQPQPVQQATSPPVPPPVAGQLPEQPVAKPPVETPQVNPAEIKTNLSGMIESAGGSIHTAVQQAAQAPPPPGFESYWKGLDSQSKLLAIGGLSIAAITMLKNMFGSKDGEEDEGFLSKALPFLGLGAAAWAAGGGTFSSMPTAAKYNELGNAFKANIPSSLAFGQ